MAIKKENLLFHYNAMFNVSDSEHDDATKNWYDLSGNGNHGKINNGIWGNNFLVLDGSKTWINAGQYVLNDGATIEILFSPSIGTEMRLFDNERPNTGGIFTKISNTGELSGTVWYNNTNKNKTVKTNVIDNELTYITLTVTNKILKIYKNGILQQTEQLTTQNFTLNSGTPPYCFAIGANANSTTGVDTNYRFRGKIYSVRLYDIALTESEITNNFLFDKAMFDLSNLQSVGNVSKVRIGQEQIYDLKDVYSRNNKLSKTEDDTAFGLINFTKGVQINKAKIIYDEVNNIVTFI